MWFRCIVRSTHHSSSCSLEHLLLLNCLACIYRMMARCVQECSTKAKEAGDGAGKRMDALHCQPCVRAPFCAQATSLEHLLLLIGLARIPCNPSPALWQLEMRFGVTPCGEFLW